MNGELRHKHYGTTIEEWILKVPGELPVDAVGLWQIVSSGREGFGLSGDSLVDFVRRCLTGLLSAGAKPVIGATDNEHIWITVDYGDKPERIIEAIVQEWQNAGRDPDVGDVWFAQPHIYQERRPPDWPAGEKPKLS
jgi:hypothetical protein